MKRIGVLLIVAFAVMAAPALFAQNHGQVGVFVDYTRLQPTETNMTGLGGRLSFNVHTNVQLEAEMGYQFTQTFLETCAACPVPVPLPEESDLRLLHGMFGPKFQTGDDDSKARFFFTVKGGFTHIFLSDRPATFGTFATTVENLRLRQTNGMLYPGVGAEFYAGPVGIRFDVGDEMIFFENERRDNLRITGGPTFRF
jgi:hypothetical protein